MSYRMLSVLMLVALALFVVGPVMAADKGDSHEGTFVKLDGTKLTMKDKDGKEHSHTIADTAKITLDGKAGKLADLKEGARIRVTTKTGDPNAVLMIEALDKDKDFPK